MEGKRDGILRRLAEEASKIRVDMLPSGVIHRAETAVIDAVEACLDGSGSAAAADILTALLKKREGEGVQGSAVNGQSASSAYVSTLFGPGIVMDPADAIFYNIVTGSVSARNDIHPGGRVHPGLTLVPAILAEAEARHIGGAKVIEAVVTGYEVMIRMGLVLQAGDRYPVSPSLRASMFAAPFGIAFALSKLLDFSIEQCANAAALALNHICGVNEWRLEVTGEDAFQNAWDALNARSAVMLARYGIAGAMGNLDGQYGFLSVFGAQEKAGDLLDGFGKRFRIMETASKPAGACIRLLAPCQLAQDLIKDPAFDLEKLERIEADVTNRVFSNAWFSSKNITGQSAAINSVPYGIAAVLTAGSIHDVSWFPPYDPAALSLMDKIGLVCDTYSRTHLEPQGCRLRAYMADGSCIIKERPAFMPLTEEQAEDVFIRTAEKLFGPERTAQMRRMGRELRELPDMAAFTQLFRK